MARRGFQIWSAIIFAMVLLAVAMSTSEVFTVMEDGQPTATTNPRSAHNLDASMPSSMKKQYFPCKIGGGIPGSDGLGSPKK
jgi:hypothetical protein